MDCIDRTEKRHRGGDFTARKLAGVLAYFFLREPSAAARDVLLTPQSQNQAQSLGGKVNRQWALRRGSKISFASGLLRPALASSTLFKSTHNETRRNANFSQRRAIGSHTADIHS